MVGIVFLKLAYTITRIYFFRKALQTQPLPIRYSTLIKKINLLNKVFVINDNKPFAFCFGIRNPKIYISTRLLALTTMSELEAVLHHEKYHLEHRDSLTHLLASMTHSLFPFLPILIDIIKHYQIQREVNADHAVTQAMNGNESLVSVLKKLMCCTPTPVFVLATSLAEWDTLELRIKALIEQRAVYPKVSFLRIGISVISILMMYGLLIAPVNAIDLHENNEDVMMVCMNDSECANWCRENATVIPPMSSTSNSSIPYTSAFTSK